MNSERAESKAAKALPARGDSNNIRTFRYSLAEKTQSINKGCSSIFRILTEFNGEAGRDAHHKQHHRTLQSIVRKPPYSDTLKTVPQPQRLLKPVNSDELSRLTKRFPFAKSTRPLIFIRPYAKCSFDKTLLERAKNELYEQLGKCTEEVAGSTQVQYLTEYGDQFVGNLQKTERRPRNLSISMVRDKIMRRTRKSHYLERLNRNFHQQNAIQ